MGQTVRGLPAIGQRFAPPDAGQKRVPGATYFFSITSAMPHFGHLPGPLIRTSESIGQT